ncbi:hypothetical protein EVAR_39771_1 [Eumeta japonica]|uniref:Cell death regulator Aven n=1 Tax=Eumeta variegata TaxID=151549 RepID=A0A4C1X736_EUMVA|nr:hypothetical protein EVAR_39771_1 [Eumeta japonica]
MSLQSGPLSVHRYRRVKTIRCRDHTQQPVTTPQLVTPFESVKQNKKNRNDAKEQRRPRSPRKHSRNHGSQGIDKKEKPDIKSEKDNEKPSSQEPGPEFYKSLKKETEEILKISEEAHAKYSKKEIHSNWKKYELSIISYEDIEEQENIGADYEQLIQTPMGTGGHFQFKHEKNWDAVITPSENVNSEKVNTAIEITLEECKAEEIKEPVDTESQDLEPANKSINFEFNELKKFSKNVTSNQQISMQVKNERDSAISEVNIDNKANMHVNLDAPEEIIGKPLPLMKEINPLHGLEVTRDEKKLDVISQKQNLSVPEHIQNAKNEVSTKGIEERAQEVSKSTPIIQSSDDLEKWLDDFLDG